MLALSNTISVEYTNSQKGSNGRELIQGYSPMIDSGCLESSEASPVRNCWTIIESIAALSGNSIAAFCLTSARHKGLQRKVRIKNNKSPTINMSRSLEKDFIQPVQSILMLRVEINPSGIIGGT